jgi:inhibitor of cysteine peptidase
VQRLAASLNYLGGVQILRVRPLRALGSLSGVRALVLAPLTLAVLTLALIGCSAKNPTTHTIEISYDDLLSQKQVQRDVELHVGDTLRLTLGANATTGYRWGPAQISDNTVLNQTEQSAQPPENPMPGAPGKETWTFTAAKAGKAIITDSYGQPWPGGEQNAWTFTADVTVTE